MSTEQMEQTKEVAQESKVLEVGTTKMYTVPFSKLILAPDNIRTDLGDIKELSNSIRQNGIITPVRGYTVIEQPDNVEKFYVVHGQRRFKAAEILFKEGLEIKVPFQKEPRAMKDEGRIIEMFLTNDGKPLTVLEQAEGVQRLVGYQWTEKDIATKLGKSLVYVKRLATLAQAPKKVKKLIQDGTISATFAMKIKGENVDEFVKNIEDALASGQANQNQEFDFSTNGKGESESEKVKVKGKTKAGKVKKVAAVTAKDVVSNNSVKEFKRFAKTHDGETFFNKEAERWYWRLSDLVNNRLNYKDFLNYFSDGTYPDEETLERRDKRNASKKQKAKQEIEG